MGGAKVKRHRYEDRGTWGMVPLSTVPLRRKIFFEFRPQMFDFWCILGAFSSSVSCLPDEVRLSAAAKSSKVCRSFFTGNPLR